MESPIAQDAR